MKSRSNGAASCADMEEVGRAREELLGVRSTLELLRSLADRLSASLEELEVSVAETQDRLVRIEDMARGGADRANPAVQPSPLHPVMQEALRPFQ